MPSRWWIPVSRIDPEPVQLEHLHGAVSGWFDRTEEEHAALIKPYALSPVRRSTLGATANTVGFEVSVLTDLALDRICASASPGSGITLGRQTGRLGVPVGLASETWDSLARSSGSKAWELDFVTPATFRSGQRASPWPAPPAVLKGLIDTWNHYSGHARIELSHQQQDTLWVSDIDGHSETMVLKKLLRISGFVGRIRYRCDDAGVADLVDPLFRLARFSGVGSAKAKGLGVTRLLGDGQPSSRRAKAAG